MPSGSYSISANQYLDLAKHVVDNGSSIPVEVIGILRRCIALRLRAVQRFAATANLANETHRHFLDVLTQIYTLFQSCRARAAAPADARDDIDGLASNRFANLALEGEDEEAEDLADIHIPGLPSHHSVQVDPEVTQAEAVFSVITFLEDIQNVRQYIENLWLDYAKGSVDLATAAVTTNTALELLCEPHNDLMRRVALAFNDDLDKMMLAVLFVICPDLRHHVPVFPNVDESDHEIAEAYDFTMFPMVQTLNGFSKLLSDPDVIPTYKAGYYGTYVPSANSHRHHFKDRWKRYQILITESFTDIYFLLEMGNIDRSLPAVLFGSRGSSSRNLFFIDELIKSFADFFQTRRWNLLMVAACQIFLDINLVLGDRTVNGLKEM